MSLDVMLPSGHSNIHATKDTGTVNTFFSTILVTVE